MGPMPPVSVSPNTISSVVMLSEADMSTTAASSGRVWVKRILDDFYKHREMHGQSHVKERPTPMKLRAFDDVYLDDLANYRAMDLHGLLKEAGITNLTDRIKIVRELLQRLESLPVDVSAKPERMEEFNGFNETVTF
jgi:hypothetical protein